ncbi:MAG: AAA family ATPase, partial [Malacoplasma sp.]|nr:AAA family ATPase [Malacoplasma sp.]
IQVEIVEEHGNLFIRKKEEKELNQKLVVFLQRETGKNDKLISEYEKTTKDVVELKKDLEEILNLEFPIIRKNEDLRFVKETSTNVASNFKELFIDDSVCLGIFEPGGGSLKNDLEHIVNSNSFKDIFESPPKTSIEQIKDEETNDFPIIQIDKLDVYQRYAVRSSLKDNTVVFGPPGTGKSEVISNIIANVLFNGKDVMMVSEKAAALEVLKKRLKSLNIFMLLIYDINNKKEFFNSIQNLSKFIGNSWLVNNGNIYKDEIKEEKIKDTLLEAKNFKNLIQKFEELKKFKHNNQTYIDFLNNVIKIGNFKTLLDIKNSDIVFKIESFISNNNISKKEFFELLNNYVNFIESENISKIDDYK